MAPNPPATPDDDPLLRVTAPLLRRLFSVLGPLCTLGVGYALVVLRPQQPLAAGLMALGYGLVAVLSLLAWRGPARRAHQLLGPALLCSLLALLGVGISSGWGLLTPGLLFTGLALLVLNLAGSGRLSAALTLSAAALVVALGLAEARGWLGQVALAGAPPLAMRVVLQLAAIAAGALLGQALGRLVRQQLRSAQAREDRFLALLGMATCAYWETDAQGRLTQLSRRDAQGRLEAQPQAVGRALWDADALRTEPELAVRLQAALRDGQALVDLPVQWQLPDGSLRSALLSGQARRDRAGRVSGFWGVARDHSAEQQARQALARSEALLSQVVTLAPDVITLTDLATGRYVMVNDSFCRLLGHAREQALGHTSLELGLWRDLADRARLVAAIERDGMALDHLISFNTRQGQELPLLISGVRFSSEGQTYLLLNGRDLTDANRVQQEREAVLANASVGIALTRDRRFVLANARFETMHGLAVGTLAGQPIESLWDDPEQVREVEQAIGPALARGEAIDIEREGKRRDGSRFLARLRGQAIDPTQPTTSGSVWIVEDVTQAREAERELARARDAAEAANRAKSAFLANTSHEIRTPLNGVLGLARLARQPGLDDERRQRYLDQMSDSAEQLSHIISDILDVAKIEAGKLQLEAAPFDLPALLQRLQRSHAPLAASQGLGFTLDVDPALPHWVRGDALRLRQILANFLHNALKFCQAGDVRLAARPLGGDRVRFEVQDSGPGIPAETQARLFQPFTQADESTTRQHGGTGLGLSICRELAGLMGGEVGLASVPGQGSLFHVVLPLPATAEPAAPGPAADAADRLQGARVLLVEDNPVNMMIGAALLEVWGVQVLQAGDGPAALQAVDEAAAAGLPVQAVLMDLQMPGISGHDTTRALRQRPAGAHLPVIALTAAALVSERELSLASGMDDFLTKPIDPLRLQQVLQRLLPPRPAAHAAPDAPPSPAT